MRVPSPTSRGALRVHFRPLDVALAIASPFFALYLSGAYVLASAEGTAATVIYGSVSILFSCAAFLVFRTEDGILQHFSVDDALKLSKAVATAVVLTCVACFALTRLDGIPRSAPVIHSLILLTGLMFVRVFASIASREPAALGSWNSAPEHLILVSSSSLAALYIKVLQAEGSARRVVSVLDSRPRMVGRAVEGVPIVGAPQNLDAVIEEYRVHGLEIDRVVIAERDAELSEQHIRNFELIGKRQHVCVDFAPRLLALKEAQSKSRSIETNAATTALSPYFRWKQAIDMVVAALLIVVLLPLIVGAAVVVLIDVGSPLLFWQRRLGARGRWFLLYKFRTLRPPLNKRGESIAATDRLSRIGRLLRDTSLDELPQLFSVLAGDMSLIGPRPLLPVDQPRNATVRLMVPPGITGWAQVNGRKSLTPEEKEQLDAWYIRNASLRVDALIVAKTVALLLSGISRSYRASEAGEGLRVSAEGKWPDGSRRVGQTQV
jgi:lipopolysaccharide/colanic/teichoic acid biosynthesis glycosyltransferase